MALYLMRHGECEGNAQNIYVGQMDSPLTERGRQQAQSAADAVVALRIDRIVSSTLSRAKDTAAIIAEKIGAPVLFDGRVMEFNPGKLTGQKIDPEVTWESFTSALEHEDPKVFKERILACLKHYRDEPGDTLFVAHSGVSRLLNTILHGLPPEMFESMPTLENGELMTIDTNRLFGLKRSTTQR